MSKKGVVLLSGGLDSATTLFIAKKKGYDCTVLSFDYGQRHRKELESARKIAKKANADFKLVKFNLPHHNSALLNKKQNIPRRNLKQIFQDEVPSTYVPARNSIFLSFALSFAEALKTDAVFIGANALDFSGYPDCRPKYFKDFSRIVKSGLKNKSIKIYTPLINKTKAQIVRTAQRLNVPLELTWSCYEGSDSPCGVCDSCLLRAKGFTEANLSDPLIK